MHALMHEKFLKCCCASLTEEDLENKSVYLMQREIKNTAVVVVTADRGLCGAFNTNIVKEALKQFNQSSEAHSEAHIFCVGKKAAEFFQKKL